MAYFVWICIVIILQHLTQEEMSEDSFFDLLSKFQSRRIDDQRCTFKVDPVPKKPVVETKKNASGELSATLWGPVG